MTRNLSRRHLLLIGLVAGCALGGCSPSGDQSGAGPGNQAAGAEARDPSQLVSSEYEVVQAMLELAEVGPQDVVADLGSGDGRIPILAAREEGARGIGVEIDSDRIRQSRELARAAGVADRVEFRQEDLFVTPLNDVTVLTLYLLPELNLQLRPKILAQMKPGTRVVSNTWDMGDWRPDAARQVGGTTIYKWVIPARVEGRWELTAGDNRAELAFSQRYQQLSVTLDGRPVGQGRLRGDRISFTADLGSGPRSFEGRVTGDRIVGEGWQARRAGTGS